jgi:Secreted/periplasmic Zn-dependent peptidases, insulinase-like
VLVQSSTKKPQELEERIENWLALFRKELASMPAEDMAKEAAAVVASLLERNMRLSDEVGTAWGSIVSAVSLGSFYNKPPFERHAKLAEILTVEDNDAHDESETSSNKHVMTKEELKSQVLDLWDRYFSTRCTRAKSCCRKSLWA